MENYLLTYSPFITETNRENLQRAAYSSSTYLNKPPINSQKENQDEFSKVYIFKQIHLDYIV